MISCDPSSQPSKATRIPHESLGALKALRLPPSLLTLTLCLCRGALDLLDPRVTVGEPVEVLVFLGHRGYGGAAVLCLVSISKGLEIKVRSSGGHP